MSLCEKKKTNSSNEQETKTGCTVAMATAIHRSAFSQNIVLSSLMSKNTHTHLQVNHIDKISWMKQISLLSLIDRGSLLGLL